MRVPQRKPGKFSQIQADPNITQEKYDQLTAKLNKLKNIDLPRELKEMDRLAQMGDFSENAGYQIAKGRVRGINYRILDIENFLKKAQIIEPNKDTTTVRLGHKVTIESNGIRKTYQILGSEETNPSSGTISHNSPLGLALINHKVGDVVSIPVNDREIEYEIIKIE